MPAVPVSLQHAAQDPTVLLATGLPELDRVLGGGLVRGSVTLLGGEPGIGKSTIVLQLCASIARAGGSCLIVTGEESVDQVGRRAARLGANVEGVMVHADSDVESILAVLDHVRPKLVVIDSIQTMSTASAGSAAGTVGQVRECAQAFTAYAKQHGVASILVGHVTKEGSLAGPRVLEHLVDTVLEFEGDRHHSLRFLRAVKHRFGSTDEVGVLEMTETGLSSVADASQLFLDDRRSGVSGSVIAPLIQGRRPMLVEIQSLVNAVQQPAQLRRLAQGLDSNRLAVVLAVLTKYCGLPFNSHDVYASVVGGIRVDEPGADLALALALFSSRKGTVISSDLVAVGEVGLGGEVRKVSHLSRRLNEVARLGFRRALVPKGSPSGPEGLKLIPVSTISEAVSYS
jgi:DNA repair protein RadA/Sms